jgi:hypothetical protein
MVRAAVISISHEQRSVVTWTICRLFGHVDRFRIAPDSGVMHDFTQTDFLLKIQDNEPVTSKVVQSHVSNRFTQ